MSPKLMQELARKGLAVAIVPCRCHKNDVHVCVGRSTNGGGFVEIERADELVPIHALASSAYVSETVTKLMRRIEES